MYSRQEYVYCIFCDTQRTEAVADLINLVLQVHCISPKIVQRYWKKGVCEERIHKYLPGYLFLYAENPVESFRDVLQFPGVLQFVSAPSPVQRLTPSFESVQLPSMAVVPASSITTWWS